MKSPITHVLLLGALLAGGCMGIEDVPANEDEAALGLSLSGELDDEGDIRWVLHNGGSEVVTVGCESGFCWDPPVLRLEARQSDLSWVTREACLAYATDRDVQREVGPEMTTELAAMYCKEPGLYRAVARVETPAGPVEVQRELAIIGWSGGDAATGLSLLERAEAEGCGMRWELRRTLLERLEPDDVLTLLGRSAVEDRATVFGAMIDRGTFVVELSDEVRAMEPDELGSFASRLAREPSDNQVPLREVVAERLFEPLMIRGQALDLEYLNLIEDYAESWPLHAPETLVLRLEEGPEEGDELAGLIDAMVRAPTGLFDADAQRILEALDGRCASAAEGSTLFESCEGAKKYFDPDVFYFPGLWGTASSRCGGAIGMVETGVCGEIDAAFRALESDAGAPEVHFLGGAVRAVDPD